MEREKCFYLTADIRIPPRENTMISCWEKRDCGEVWGHVGSSGCWKFPGGGWGHRPWQSWQCCVPFGVIGAALKEPCLRLVPIYLILDNQGHILNTLCVGIFGH